MAFFRVMNSTRRLGTLPLFILGVVGIGIVIGILTGPGEWYAALAKPDFNPPNWVFGPVWTLLYVLIGIVGWRVWGHSPLLRVLWFIQMGLNFLWSPVFFGLQHPAGALAVIVVLLLTIVFFVVKSWKIDRPSALMFMPYLLWVTFATVLNLQIVQLN